MSVLVILSPQVHSLLFSVPTGADPTDPGTGAPLLACFWLDSVNGRHWQETGGQEEKFSLLPISFGAIFLIVAACVHDYSFYEIASSSWLWLPLGASVTISCSCPTLPLSLRVGPSCSLFLVSECLTILCWFPYPCLYLYNVSLWGRYFSWV